MKIILSSLLVLIIVLLACSKENSLPSEAVSDKSGIIPLKVGNYWVGKVTYFDENGKIDSTFNDTTRVNNSVTINNESWYLLDDILTRNANRSDGLWIWNNWDSGGVPFLRFKYPTLSGDTYVVGDNPREVMKVLSTNKLVIVPNGNFECYHYKSTVDYSALAIIREYYLSVGNGFVKTKIYLTENSINYLWLTWELLDFKLY